MNEQIEAVRVHVASVDAGVSMAAAPAPRRKPRGALFYTVVLTAESPVQQVLPPASNRVIAYVQAGGNNVVLATTKGEAQSKANTGDTTLANPVGCVLPYGNSAPYPLDTAGEVWAAAAAYPAQIAVTAIIEAED